MLSDFYFKAIQDDKVLALPMLKAVADDNFILVQFVQFFFDWVENIVEKWENAGNQYFLLFPQCFQKSFSSGVSKAIIVW